MSNSNAKLAEVVARDPRYAYEAYEFVFQALDHTQKQLGRVAPPDPGGGELSADSVHHVKGFELVEGIRSLALQEFGLMARTVFHMWGIHQTVDFGRIVFNLVEADLMSSTPEDSLADFEEVFDFQEALVQGYRIQLDEAR